MWDERYNVPHYVYGTQPNDFLRQQMKHIKPGGKVLCLAEGEGRNAVFLATQGYLVTAVDASQVGCNKAQALASKAGVSLQYHCQDLSEFDPGTESWDGIVSIFCHLPVTVRMALHAKLVAALKTGGVLLLEAYTPEQLQHGTGGPPSVELMMTASQLEQELIGLELLRLEELEREVVEGVGHTGVGAVVQLVARRPR